MYRLIRAVLFLFAPEVAHSFTAKLLHVFLKVPGMKKCFHRASCVQDERLKRTLWGLTFDNPIGLAAGFDKNAKLYNDFAHCGFSFIEIGTVTPQPQLGNPKPRLFRLKKDKALINRMGFNNVGAKEVVEQLKKRNTTVVIGGNIGKNKNTPNERATEDYLSAFATLYAHVDYFVVNVSSPNTPNLRELQEKHVLQALLSALQEKNNATHYPKPILVKIAPDLSNEQLDDIIDIVYTTKIHGIIATNTTLDRSNLSTSHKHIANGGLSGRPIAKRSTEVIRYLSEKSKQSIPIIGVGGIHSPEDAIEKFEAGASLIQLYTGFVYEGPKLIKRINHALLTRKKH